MEAYQQYRQRSVHLQKQSLRNTRGIKSNSFTTTTKICQRPTTTDVLSYSHLSWTTEACIKNTPEGLSWQIVHELLKAHVKCANCQNPFNTQLFRKGFSTLERTCKEQHKHSAGQGSLFYFALSNTSWFGLNSDSE